MKIKSFTGLMIILIFLVAAFILMIYELDIRVSNDDIIFMSIFLIGAFILIYFLLIHEGAGRKEKSPLEAMLAIKEQFREYFGVDLVASEPPEQATTRTFPLNNKTYYGFRFEIFEGGKPKNAAATVIWCRDDNMIHDWDISPVKEKRLDPLAHFDPVHESPSLERRTKEIEGYVKFGKKSPYSTDDNIGGDFDEEIP